MLVSPNLDTPRLKQKLLKDPVTERWCVSGSAIRPGWCCDASRAEERRGDCERLGYRWQQVEGATVLLNPSLDELQR